ncbi:DUF4190 domain-containing protein, partial [Streptomyces sp. AcH 505]|uniref:DUF4190 domain-containing protein n=1 Tax=Streptomyces sp. AcH 505 TaxID=352211 RepID=UPI0018E37E2A
PAYGYPGYPAYGQLGPQQGNRDGMGTAALVLGIISVVGFCLVGVDILIGGLALTLGILGRARARKGVASNGGVALAGMILGAVGVVFATVFLVFVIWASNQDENERDSTDRYPTYDTSLVVPR